MSEFKVGDIVRMKTGDNWINEGLTAQITGITIKGCYLKRLDGNPDGRSESKLWICPEALELVKGKTGRPRKVKPEGRLSFKVLEDECNNFNATIKANTAKEAVSTFKKDFKGKSGYTLYKPLWNVEERKKSVFKEVK